jgi:hypothetical protein
VTPENVVRFLQDDVLKRTVRKKITARGGYEGVVGIRKDTYKEEEEEEEEGEEEEEEMERREKENPSWVPLEEPLENNQDQILWSEANINQENINDGEVRLENDEEEVDQSSNSNSKKRREPALIGSVQDKTNGN